MHSNCLRTLFISTKNINNPNQVIPFSKHSKKNSNKEVHVCNQFICIKCSL